MASICPKCGKFMEGGVCEKCQAAEAAEKYNEKMAKKKRFQKEQIKTEPASSEAVETSSPESTEAPQPEAEAEVEVTKKKSWIPIVAGLLVVIVGIPLITFLVAINNAKKAYVSEAEEDFAELQKDYNNKNYFSVLFNLKEYERYYSEDDEYYKALPETLRAEYVREMYTKNIGDKLMGEINKWEKAIETSNSKTYGSGPVSNEMKTKNASVTDYSYYTKLTEALLDFKSCFPEGYTYTDESGKTKKFGTASEIENMYKNYKYREILIQYTKGEKTPAIESLRNYIDNGYASSNKSHVEAILYIMKINHPAKDYKITGGSKEVTPVVRDGQYVKNYHWTCPYCGYVSQYVGAPYDIDTKDHYPGEVYRSNRGMVCASAFQGGCKQMSSYQLEITFE